MPPKKDGVAQALKARKDAQKAAGKKTGGILREHQKGVRFAVLEEKKAIDIDTLTPEMIENTPQITVLKSWAKLLGVKNLAGYKVANINDLRKVMIQQVKERKQREPGDLVIAIQEEDADAEKQYTAVEAFLKSYALNPKKTTVMYGKVGEEFTAMWNPLTLQNKAVFIKDYFQLNIPPYKVNPVTYIKKFIESSVIEKKDTLESITMLYLRLFLRNIEEDNPQLTQQMQEITDNPLFSKEFLSQFNSLDKNLRMRFASQYIRVGFITVNPTDSLKMFLTSASPKVAGAKRIQAQPIEIAGAMVRRDYMTDEDKAALVKNDYQKCLNRLYTENWILQDVDMPEDDTQMFLGFPTEFDTWYYPSDEFFLSLCHYHSYLKSPTENIIVVNMEKKRQFRVAQERDGALIQLSPNDIASALLQAQAGTIYKKVTPYWILNTPMYQVDSQYILAIQFLLYIGMQDRAGDNPERVKAALRLYDKIISDLEKSSRTETLLTYYVRFAVTFFHLIPNSLGIVFPIGERLENGYLTPEAFSRMSLAEKIPGINVPMVVTAIEKYVLDIAPKILDMESYFAPVRPQVLKPTMQPFFVIQLEKSMFVPVECDEKTVNQWYPRDLIAYKNRCYPIPELLSQFLRKDYTDRGSGGVAKEDFDPQFVKDFLARYEHLAAEAFVTRQYFEVTYVDKALFDAKHPMVLVEKKKDVYSGKDLSEQFNRYFNVTAEIIDPVALIQNIIGFKIGESCAECKKDLPVAGVTSMVNRSDGTTVKISFCDYQCMMKHEFQPLHTAEEEIPDDHRATVVASTVIESV